MEICTSLADYLSVLPHLLHLIWGRVLAIFLAKFPSEGFLMALCGIKNSSPKPTKFKTVPPHFGAQKEKYIPLFRNPH